MKPGMAMITLRMPVSMAEILRTRAKSVGLSINAYCMLTLAVDWMKAGVLSTESPAPKTVPAPIK